MYILLYIWAIIAVVLSTVWFWLEYDQSDRDRSIIRQIMDALFIGTIGFWFFLVYAILVNLANFFKLHRFSNLLSKLK